MSAGQEPFKPSYVPQLAAFLETQSRRRRQPASPLIPEKLKSHDTLISETIEEDYVLQLSEEHLNEIADAVTSFTGKPVANLTNFYDLKHGFREENPPLGNLQENIPSSVACQDPVGGAPKSAFRSWSYCSTRLTT
jgi:hypothetical protein